MGCLWASGVGWWHMGLWHLAGHVCRNASWHLVHEASPLTWAPYQYAQNKQAVEEQHKLQTEKSALIDTVKKLNREVAKLESFKRSLMQHLQDDDEVRSVAH